TIASKEYAYDQFDSTVQTNTVVKPGSDSGVIRIKGTDKALAITTDCNSRYIYLDPETGGKIAVAEAARNIVSSGARPIGLTDGLNFGNPTNPEVFWQMKQSVEGMSEAARMLETPVVSGNVSLYNQSNGRSIFPTPVVGMVGLIESLEYLTPNFFQEPGDLIYVIGETKAEFGGSELQNVVEGTYQGKAPFIDLQVEAERQKQLFTAIRQDLVQSAHDLAEGGLGVALAESVFNDKGLGLEADIFGNPTTALFSETQSRFLVTVKPHQQRQFEAAVTEACQIGTVTDHGKFLIRANDET